MRGGERFRGGGIALAQPFASLQAFFFLLSNSDLQIEADAIDHTDSQYYGQG
ncbi:hypothetical protein [Methanothrix sp.]|uniref:hypothetical protein n=1 Tax=Methanothrix sp. TaxID=90426 RepID=UPI003C714FA9